MNEPFNPLLAHQQVQLRHDPGRRGVSTGKIRETGTRTYVQIEFGPHERTFIDAEELEAVTLGEADVGELLTNLRFGKKGDLARILTFHKLSSQLANVFYAMQTSRTDFYAYQFKPVYKFIESANGRILIADEVGLGKTIEAGLIWQEVKARTGAEKLLVICPSMLRPKWKKELRTRFHLQAEIYDSRGFLALLEDFEREPQNFQCVAVCSAESLRQEKALEAMEEFSKSDLFFDLAVIDEAHYLRNSGTRTHQMGQAVSGITEHLIMLTATPIHLKNEDLYRLLNVLDRDEYSNQFLFESRITANEPIVTAQNALRRIPADLQTAKQCVQKLSGSQWFRNNPLTEIVVDKLAVLDPNNHPRLIEVNRLLENLNLLDATISRTRKREVQEWRVVRKASVLDLEFHPHEKEFYHAVTNAVRKQLSHYSGQGFEAFSLMMPQRQMASCIPAMVEHYRQFLSSDVFAEDDVLQEDLGLFLEDDEANKKQPTISNDLASLIKKWDDTYPDSKYEALITKLRSLFVNEPDVKIVLFSYFRKTLAYLNRRLQADGYAPAVIHGGIGIEERQEIIEQFAGDPYCRILLSSEVGAEGVDLQFCRIVINYDLPWNPMKVEQRIGRIDRIGQQANLITIINIAAKETIEEKILERLYKRIGIFERSIGELEPILGELIQKLTLDLFSAALTPKQEEERIEQTRRALEEKSRQERELEDKSSLFFGNSDFILEQIQSARKTGRWVTPAELRSYITDFFQHHYVGTRIAWNKPTDGFVNMHLSNEARFELASFCRRQRETRTVLTQSGTESVVLGYTSEAIKQRQDLEFLSHFHGLTRWITQIYKEEKNPFFRTSAVEVKSDLVKPGDYLFLIELWRFIANQDELLIAYALTPIQEDLTLDAEIAELLLQEILDSSQNWAYADQLLDENKVQAAFSRCSTDIEQRREEAFEIFQRKTIGAAQRKSAHLENHLARREESFNKSMERQNYRLQHEELTREQRMRIERLIKGDKTKVENVRQNTAEKLQELEKASRSRAEFEEIAGGVCRVSN